jgi:hypothetical protein
MLPIPAIRRPLVQSISAGRRGNWPRVVPLALPSASAADFAADLAADGVVPSPALVTRSGVLGWGADHWRAIKICVPGRGLTLFDGISPMEEGQMAQTESRQ